jgi:alpha-galactosidase
MILKEKRLLERFTAVGARALQTDGSQASTSLVIEFTMEEGMLIPCITNRGDTPVALREIVLAEIAHGLPADTPLHGEGFAMFSGAIGTINKPRNLDSLSDAAHYRLPSLDGSHRAYNVLQLGPVDGCFLLLGAASCRRFHVALDINARILRVSVLAEGLTLGPGETWQLEEIFSGQGPDSGTLLDGFAARLAVNHPHPAFPEPPIGWCSWLSYGPSINADIIRLNLDALRQNAPEFRFIQIDDGYQPWMGDWLEPKPVFPDGIGPLANSITQAGFLPAIWVAPFIASPESRLFRENPGWFIKDEDGNPLRSDAVTFGGWRQGPWYMLDGTHPDARVYLGHVFRTFRSWGITYFKLDANLWGAFPAGCRHDPHATSVEAYRRGMEAILEAVGADSFLLGCNHPVWPSLGLIHGARTSNDISYTPSSIRCVASQNIRRNWMNGRLWWNDPDTLQLRARDAKPDVMGPDGKVREGTADPAAFSFHFAATLASGGLLLAGDCMADYGPEEWRRLRIALAAPRSSARFADNSLGMGWTDTPSGERWVFLLNWDKAPARRELTGLDAAAIVTDPVAGAVIPTSGGRLEVELPPFSGLVLVITPE